MILQEKMKKPIAVIAAAAMCMTLWSGTASAMGKNTTEETVYKEADGDALYKHVTELSENIGVRLMGTDNEYKAAEYIEGELDSYGYDAQILEYQIPDGINGPVAAFKIGEKEYYGNYYFDGEMTAIENPAISNCTVAAEEVTDLDIISTLNMKEGSLVVINNGLFSKLESLSAEKAATDKTYTKLKATDFINQAITKAEESGALGMVIYSDTTNRSLKLSGVSGNSIPVLTADVVLGEKILNEGVTEISKVSRSESWNVCAVKEAETAEPSAIIHVTGHLDSVMGAPGATDNASAAAALLELAKNYKDVDNGNIEIRFIAVGGEEAGLNGSEAYVNTLTPEESAISINFNMDMLSTSWEGANAVSLDVSPRNDAVFNVAAALIITGSSDMEFIAGTENLRWYQYGSSDHVSFQDKGIDAASMIRATDDTDDIEPVNHTVEDSMDKNYSLERHVECTNMISKGIAKAIDNEFTKTVEYYKEDGENKITAANAKALSNLYDEIIYSFEKPDGTTVEVTGFKANDFAVMVPEDATLVSAQAVGTGVANVKGTYGKPITESYISSMIVKEVAKETANPEDPAAGNDGNQQEQNSEKSAPENKAAVGNNNGTPKTSDTFELMTLVALMVASGMTGLLALKGKTKKVK